MIFQGRAQPIQTFFIIFHHPIHQSSWVDSQNAVLKKAAASVQFNLSTGYDLSFVINESLPIPPMANDTHDIRNASNTQEKKVAFILSHRAFVYVFNSLILIIVL